MTHITEMALSGILIDKHTVKDAESKLKAINSLYGWRRVEMHPRAWIGALEEGCTIQPSAFEPLDDGKWTHAIDQWRGTHFVCCDADNLKGVEFLSDGTDKNPDGVEPFTDEKGLSALYPSLKDKAYAVGQSVSSMSNAKSPPHRRYRLVFLFDEQIMSEKHYHAILLALSAEFPIIPAVERSPAQPVFGNAREGYNQFHVCDNVLKLSDYPMPSPKATGKARSASPVGVSEKTLDTFLMEHGIEFEACTKEVDKYFVRCPFTENHTDAVCKPKDAYVFVNAEGAFAFHCSHASCKSAGRTNWEALKQGYGIKTQKGMHATEVQDTIPEPMPVKAEDNSDIPFPVDAFEGTIFGEYEKAYSGRNETCPAFRFAELAVAMSALFGRKIYVKVGEDYTFPNFFGVLVGRSVIARKSASISKSLRLVSEHKSDTMLLSRSVDSAEGFISQLAQVEDTRMGLYIDEMRSLFIKGGQKATAGIFPTLNQAFNGDEHLENNTKTDDSVAVRPTVSMLGCLTPNWFNESVSMSGIGGGFFNRLAYFLHEQMPLKSRTEVEAPNAECLAKVKHMLRSIAELQQTTKFEYGKGAVKHERDYYHERMPPIIKSNDDIEADTKTRTDVHVEKIAMMLAWTGNSRQDTQIHLKDYKRAVEFGKYLEKVNERLFAQVTFDAYTAQEQRVLKALEELGNTATKNELSTKIGRQYLSARDLARILDALVSNEVIAITQEGRPTRIIRLPEKE